MSADLRQGRFKDQLGDQLEAAARRRTELRGLPAPLGASPGQQSWSRPKLALAAGFLIIVAGALALVAAPTSTSRAEANMLEFTYEQDQTIVEVTGGPEVHPGDPVVLFGGQGSDRITAQEWSDRLDTIPYEVVCGFSVRLPRQVRPDALSATLRAAG